MRPSGCDWKQLQRGTTAKKNFRGGALHPWKREPLLTILNSFPVEGLKILVRRCRCPLLSTRISLQKLPFCWKRERERERVEKKNLKGGALHTWIRESLLTILNGFPLEGLKVLVRRFWCPLLSTIISLQKLPFCWERERERDSVEVAYPQYYLLPSGPARNHSSLNWTIF